MTRSNHLVILNSDIICGRGKGFDRYAGNQIFREVIKEYSSTYIGFGTNRIAKSNTLRKVFENIVVHKNMRFVTYVKKQGWVLLKERDIKLKIGHALRDFETVRQKQAARRRTETRRSKKEKRAPIVIVQPPVGETTQLRFLLPDVTNDDERKKNQPPNRAEEEHLTLQEERSDKLDCDSTKDAPKPGVLSQHPGSNIQSCYCDCQRSAVYEQQQKQEVTVGMDSDGLALLNVSNKFIPLEYTSCSSIPFVSDAHPSPHEWPSRRTIDPSAPDFEPLPLSYDFPMDKDELKALNFLDGDVGSFSLDAALSAVLLDFTEVGDFDEKAALADAQPADVLKFCD